MATELAASSRDAEFYFHICHRNASSKILHAVWDGIACALSAASKTALLATPGLL